MNYLIKDCSQEGECKIEENMIAIDYKNEFARKLGMEEKELRERYEQDFNIEYAENLKIRLDNFTNSQEKK